MNFFPPTELELRRRELFDFYTFGDSPFGVDIEDTAESFFHHWDGELLVPLESVELGEAGA